MNHIVQLLLPLETNSGSPIAKALFSEVRETLVKKFGGLTTYSRAPAHGIWADEDAQDEDPQAVHDDIVVFEVMVQNLDETWWAGYREKLRVAFEQESLVVRASAIQIL